MRYRELSLLVRAGSYLIKKVINKMVEEEVLEFWSSGSTTMYGLKGSGKQHSSEGEE